MNCLVWDRSCAIGLVVALTACSASGAISENGVMQSSREPAAGVDLSEQLPTFTSLPSIGVRDCILETAEISDMIADYDQLDRDFLVSYASKLSLEEFASKAKGEKIYADDLDAEAMGRLLHEAKSNRQCRDG